MSRIMQRLAERFDPESLADAFARLAPNVVTALLVLAAFVVVARLLDAGLRRVLRRVALDETLASFIRSALRFSVLAIGVLTALRELGINITAILASLGVVGLTIGFAARDTLSNVISGVFIFWDRPFVLGDLIEIDGRYGRVSAITLRSTRVVTPDGKMLALPNATIVNSAVASFTNFPHLRLDLDFTVGVRERFERIREVFRAALAGDRRLMSEPAPEMVVTAIGDYSVGIQFRIWIEDEKQHVPLRFELRERLFEALRAAGVDMPLETLQLAPLRVEGRLAGGRS